jgi:hypothetical protein
MKNNHIVSIGRNCLPRTVATRAGIQISKAEGELSLPFDLAVSSYSGVCDLVENDFTEFLNPTYLKLNAKNIIYHSKYDFYFNHESVNGRHLKFGANNFAQLINVYRQRIKNWHHKLTTLDKILFITNHEVFPSKFHAIIHKQYPHLSFRILTLYTSRPTEGTSEKDILAFYKQCKSGFPNIDYIFMPQPTARYAWYKKEHYHHVLGKAFEQTIACNINESLNKLDAAD